MASHDVYYWFYQKVRNQSGRGITSSKGHSIKILGILSMEQQALLQEYPKRYYYAVRVGRRAERELLMQCGGIGIMVLRMVMTRVTSTGSNKG